MTKKMLGNYEDDFNRLRIFTGNSNPALVQMISDRLETPIGKAMVKTFSDGEINVEIHESVRGMDVFVIQSICYPVNTNLFAAPVLLDYLRNLNNDIVVVSPDAGGVERARAFAKRLNASLAIIDKRRDAPNVSQVMNIIGDVQGLIAVLLDDIVDTGGTLVRAAYALVEKGAKSVYACCTHPVLSGNATQMLSESPIQELVVTDTIPLKESALGCSKIKVLSVSGLLTEAIQRIYKDESVSNLFV
jgi:phosphoribosylpyrophosphate synthetase